jgi:hypothetical protein
MRAATNAGRVPFGRARLRGRVARRKRRAPCSSQGQVSSPRRNVRNGDRLGPRGGRNSSMASTSLVARDMKDTSRPWKRLAARAMLAAGFGLGACSTGDATCESSACPTGNSCVAGYDTQADEAAGDVSRQTTKCRLTCDLGPDDSSISFQDKCPHNYHCAAGGSSAATAVAYCVPDKVSYSGTTTAGRWGTSCNPAEGMDGNPSCDVNNGFSCYGISPADANAFCTQYGCAEDADCKGGYWCATINSLPNVTTLKRSYGVDATTTVCLPRKWGSWQGSYCAPCKSDVDCPTNNGAPQHCVSADGGSGTEKICAVECGTDRSCNLDGKCTSAEGTAARVCLPRAGTCRGDGGLCSPCRSDADCTDGYCIGAEVSSERFCTTKSKKPCGDGTSDCPAALPGTLGGGCFSAAAGMLKDQCLNFVQAGTNPATKGPASVIGCWTIARTD